MNNNMTLPGLDLPDTKAQRLDVGGGFQLEIKPGTKGKEKAKIHLGCQVTVYRKGTFHSYVNFADSVAKRVCLVELIEQGALQNRLAEALQLSRQTIHNWVSSKNQFGFEGLVNNYKVSDSKSRTKQRKEKASGLGKGNKARQLEAHRQELREHELLKEPGFDFSDSRGSNAQSVLPDDQLYAGEHDWKPTRYAGVFVPLLSLIGHWDWLNLIQGLFGNSYRIFMVFLLMVSRNIRSIENLKHVRLKEAGSLLGLGGQLPAQQKLWSWFYSASGMGNSLCLLWTYFRHQLKTGLVSNWLWFTDGHLLPYTGKESVRKGFFTQRRMPHPGQTNHVTCDGHGRIVDFVIEEGHGDLRRRIIDLAQKWSGELESVPTMVFDREGSGLAFFSELVKKQIRFVTWEKNANRQRLLSLPEEKFTLSFVFNGKEYRAFEEQKRCNFKPEKGEVKAELNAHDFTLRRILIWNLSSNRRTSGLAWDGTGESNKLSTEDCAEAILSRWGASENTFKEMKNRHPLHYHPGFSLDESKNQSIANPKLKEVSASISGITKELNKLYKKINKTPAVYNKDRSIRMNSKNRKLAEQISKKEKQIHDLQEVKKSLPEYVDARTLTDYRSFQRIDNEGKNLFDFVTTSVWNSRKLLIDWLRPEFNNGNEVVDLFYAICDCHGWVKSSREQVTVRLEPLQQPRRRAAQNQLCNRLNRLCARIPNGKWLRIEVGQDPKKL